MGRHPAEASGALLVSCPCDVRAWRRHMAKAQLSKVGPFALLFLASVSSLSPLDTASGIPRSARVRLVVGSRDTVAPAGFSVTYAAALKRQGIDAPVDIVPGLEHDILLEPVVLDRLKLLVSSLQ